MALKLMKRKIKIAKFKIIISIRINIMFLLNGAPAWLALGLYKSLQNLQSKFKA